MAPLSAMAPGRRHSLRRAMLAGSHRAGEADAHLEAKFPESQRVGDTAALMAGVNPAAVPARDSQSSLALTVRASTGARSVLTNNDLTETTGALTVTGRFARRPGARRERRGIRGRSS